MCGISGRFMLNEQAADQSIISQMTKAIAHRGPDAEGYFVKGPISLGHRRLSIIDLSERSNQPLFDSTGRYAIVFNGEIYNYASVKSQLLSYPFATNGDTEVVLAAYLKWGPDSLQHLAGMFAFAIWDQEAQTLFIARDRMGVKPLYYYRDQHQFLFASEIRSILASGQIKRKICREALIDFFAFQSFQSPQSIVEGVLELPAGHYLTISRTSFDIKPYWQIEKRLIPGDYSNRSLIEKRVSDLLTQSVERRMVSDVPVAAFLSGGIDSSVVVGLMSRVVGTPETFNISFNQKDFDESEYAELIAKKFKTRHHPIRLEPEVFLHEFPNALNAMDSPSGDGINTYVVSKAIKEAGIKVALSGVGGDELFAGYPIFKHWLKIHQRAWLARIPKALRAILASLMGGQDIRKLRMAQLLTLPDYSIDKVYPILRQVNANATIRRLTGHSANSTFLSSLLEKKASDIRKFPLYSQLSIAEYLGYTGQTLLKDTDQMSMAVALEIREPFFDHELVEYVMNIPDRFKEGMNPKSLLLNATGDLIPPEIYQRPKKGFTFPWNSWIRGELKSYCDHKIRLLAEKDFVNGPAVLSYWKDFLQGQNQIAGTNILLLVTLENYTALHSLE